MMMSAASAILLGAVAAGLYGTMLRGLLAQWIADPDTSYGLALAVVAFAVCWQRRRTLVEAVDHSSPPLPGLLLLVLAVAVNGAAQLAADVFLTRVSFVVALAGTIWFLAGPRAVRVLGAPLFLLLAAIPLPTLIVNAATLPLQLVASRGAELALGLGGVPVFRDGNVLQLPSATLEVAKACSGMRSLASLGAVGLLVAWGTDQTLWRRLVVVLSTIPIAVATNAGRIAATGAACEVWGQRAAEGTWHTLTGWVAFVAALLALLALQRLLGAHGAAGRRTPEAACA